MAKDERLIRRGDSFYYQRRVPVDLVSALGKKVIKQSLNTKDRAEARKLREIHDVKWSAQFEQLRQVPSSKIANLKPAINMPSPEGLVRKYVERKLKVFEARIVQEPPENEEQRNEMISNAEFEALQVKKETPQGIEWISDALEAIEKEAGQEYAV